MAIIKNPLLDSVKGTDLLSKAKTIFGDDVQYNALNDEYLYRGHDGHIRRIDKMSLLTQNPPWVNAAVNTTHTLGTYQTGASQLGNLIEMEPYRMKVLAMRLRLRDGERFPYQFLTTAYANDKVFVFVVQDGQAVTLTDEAPMFPSDQLITQLRLLDK